jgi:hypothetical protein
MEVVDTLWTTILTVAIMSGWGSIAFLVLTGGRRERRRESPKGYQGREEQHAL